MSSISWLIVLPRPERVAPPAGACGHGRSATFRPLRELAKTCETRETFHPLRFLSPGQAKRNHTPKLCLAQLVKQRNTPRPPGKRHTKRLLNHARCHYLWAPTARLARVSPRPSRRRQAQGADSVRSMSFPNCASRISPFQHPPIDQSCRILVETDVSNGPQVWSIISGPSRRGQPGNLPYERERTRASASLGVVQTQSGLDREQGLPGPLVRGVEGQGREDCPSEDDGMETLRMWTHTGINPPMHVGTLACQAVRFADHALLITVATSQSITHQRSCHPTTRGGSWFTAPYSR